jgi:hypothetical protein
MDGTENEKENMEDTDTHRAIPFTKITGIYRQVDRHRMIHKTGK